MTKDRVDRTDEKTGFRVDRASSTDAPFYGTQRIDDPLAKDEEGKKKGRLITNESNQLGRPGVANAELEDRAGVVANHHNEFISTATDTDSGKQYDAIFWGFKSDDTNATIIEPKLLPVNDPLLVGRERAIHKWNQDIAQDGDNKVPTEHDPTEVAQLLKTSIESTDTNKLDAVRFMLDNPYNNAEGRIARVKANYEVETGRSLPADLKALLNSKDEKKFKAWL